MKRCMICLIALLLTGIIVWLAIHVRPTPEHLPGADAPQRRLLRIWLASSVGGGESWLRECLKTWEKANPGTMTFLRSVTPDELTRENAVLPDILLYTPGTITTPDAHFAPLTGISGTREELLRSGRWKGQQYGLPLCYAAYALAIDSACEPHLAATPAPTTLLGRPAATQQPLAAATPALPEGIALTSPRGCGLFTLRSLITTIPTLPDDFATLDSSAVYQLFRTRKANAALLTTGQITALGASFPFRVMTPGEIITDQVWLASLFHNADPAAAELLTWLISAPAQRMLCQQSLHTVREDLRLYAAGTEALIETAASRSLTVLNAYVPPEETEAAAWQYFHGRTGLSEALLPLL